MSTRYLTNVGLAVTGAFLVVTSFAFSVSTFEWLSLGGGIAAIALSAAIALKDRGRYQRGFDLAAIAIGTWLIVESQVYTGSRVEWLGFAAGAGLAALALIGLTAHELSTERVVHSLEVTHAAQNDAAETSDREFAHVA